MSSILTDVKRQLGITEEYEHFDKQLVICINSAFSVLHMLGTGPDDGFFISDKTTEWTSFLEEGPILSMVKEYIPLKVQLLFDTSTMTSAVIAVNERHIAEFEWRIQVAVENLKTEIQNEE